MTKKELKEILIEDFGVDKEELKGMSRDDLKVLYEEYSDVSDLLPNESLEEYMEHENFDW